ncbi:MAG: hypothetical protein HY340_00250 [Candidatus Kerfeldbacteria bacterium]|nr:hypothetical protein [Candidatus Kerfeldbacteria bacterium]
MMMRNAIQSFHEQFRFEPTIENEDRLPKANRFVVLGMGGSHLAADLLLCRKPDLALTLHSDYGLPAGNLSDALIIASSYSGNTAETLDGAFQALQRRLPVAAIGVDGQLIGWASKKALPFIRLPNTHIQPRAALGLSLRALLTMIGDRELLDESKNLAKTLKPSDHEVAGKHLAVSLRGKVPVIYASTRNRAIAYNWKIKLNETGKIPAFMNVVPELNHNEMTGFDTTLSTQELSARFHVIILKDAADDPRVSARMDVLAKLYNDRRLAVTVLELAGRTPFEKIFASLLTADWCALAIAEHYGVEATEVPMVEEFKKQMSTIDETRF